MERLKSRIKHQDGEFYEREHLIYRREEADEIGLEYKEDYWDCQPGEWGLTKDGYVVECVKRTDKEPRRQKKSPGGSSLYQTSYLRFSIGRVITGISLQTGSRTTTPLTWEDRKAVGDFCQEIPRTWGGNELKRKTTPVALDLYTDIYIEKEGKLTREDFRRCGIVYRKNAQIPEATFKRLLKSPDIQERVSEIMKDKLKEKGITEDSVLDMYLETYDLARTGGEKGPQTSVMRGVANDLMTLLRDQQDAPATLESEFDDRLLEAALQDELLLKETNGQYAQVEQ